MTDERQFIKMFSSLSARFINLPADRLDGEIEAAQESVCTAMGIDRCSLWQLSPGNEHPVLTHIWAKAPHIVPAGVLSNQAFPWVTASVMSGETIRFSTLDDVPPGQSVDRESFRKYGIRSNVTIPLSAGGRVFGAIAFGVLQDPR